MTEKPQRFKILRSGDPDELALQVSEHMNGIERADDKGTRIKYFYTLHGDTRVVFNQFEFPGEDPPQPLYRYEQCVYIHSIFDPSLLPSVEPVTDAVQ